MVMQYHMEGKPERTIGLPGVGSASGFTAKKTENRNCIIPLRLIFTRLPYSNMILLLEAEVFKKSGVQFDPSKYKVRTGVLYLKRWYQDTDDHYL